MKKTTATLLISALLVASLAACDHTDNQNEPESEQGNSHTTDNALIQEELDPATYMSYSLNADGKSYTASPYGLPDAVKELVFPGEYKGLPVTEINIRLDEHSIESIIISEGVKVISGGFDYCTDIKNIYIPASVVSISDHAFNCRATMGGHGFIKSNVIEKIVVAEGNPCYYVDGNCLIEKSSQKIILGCNSSVLPTDGSVKSIGYAAFANCHSIETVILPKSIIEIEASAFDNCDNLKKVYITSSVSEDDKVVNFDPEAVFGHAPLDLLCVPDAESLEMYSKLLGEAYFNMETPFDRVLSIEKANETNLTKEEQSSTVKNGYPLNSSYSGSSTYVSKKEADIYVVEQDDECTLYVPKWDKYYPVLENDFEKNYTCATVVEETAWVFFSPISLTAEIPGYAIYTMYKIDNITGTQTKTEIILPEEMKSTTVFCSMIDESNGFFFIFSQNEQTVTCTELRYLLSTQDGGETWQTIEKDDSWFVTDWRKIPIAAHFFNKNMGILVSRAYANSAGGLQVTLNGGQTWEYISLPFEDYDSEFLNDDYRYAELCDFEFDIHLQKYTLTMQIHSSEQSSQEQYISFTSPDLINWEFTE